VRIKYNMAIMSNKNLMQEPKAIKMFLDYAKNGDAKNLKYLIDKKIAINVIDPSDPEKNTALHLAVSNNHPEVAALLLKHGAEVNAVKANKNRSAAIHIAAVNGYVKIVDLLLSYNADIHQSEQSGMTALHLAVSANHLSTVTLLILSGADINKKNILGASILQTAALRRSKKILKILIAYSCLQDYLGEEYIDFLARLVGSSITNEIHLYEKIKQMLEIKILMFWGNNRIKIEKKAKEHLTIEKNASSNIKFIRKLLIQCINYRVSNKIFKHLHTLSEMSHKQSFEKVNLNQLKINQGLKDDFGNVDIKAKLLQKKIDILQNDMHTYVENLEFEKADKLYKEILQLTQLKKIDGASISEDQKKEVKYKGILGQMKLSKDTKSPINKILTLKHKLYLHAEKFEFDEAAQLRDEIIKLEEESLK
jgi:ankyrin repeat protein